MPPTATEDKLTSLEGKLDLLTKKADELSRPNYGAVRTDAEGRVTSFIEPTDERAEFTIGESRDAVQRKSYRQQSRQNTKQLRSMGYQPWGEFKSFKDVVRGGFEGHQTESYRKKWQNHYKAIQGMNESSGSDGGYAVMPEFAPNIIDRVYENNLWGLTDNYSVTGNNLTFLANAETSRANGSRHGGLRGYWLDEAGTITKSKPTFRRVSLELCKLGVVVYLTQQLIDDNGYALEQYVTRKAAEEFNFMIGDALFNGTGNGQPLGVLNAPSLIAVTKEGGQLADTLQTENFFKMLSRFFAPNYGSANWYHNQDVLPQLQQLVMAVGAGGVPTYLPPGGLSDKPYGSMFARPCVPTEFNPTLGDQGDVVLADLGQMLSISKGGIAQAVSMHLEFLTDQLALRFTMRLNARPWENAPITPYKGTNTQSSFVTLEAR